MAFEAAPFAMVLLPPWALPAALFSELARWLHAETARVLPTSIESAIRLERAVRIEDPLDWPTSAAGIDGAEPCQGSFDRRSAQPAEKKG